MSQNQGPSATRFLAISEVEFVVLQQLVEQVPVKSGYLANTCLVEGVAARSIEGYTTEVASIVQNKDEVETPAPVNPDGELVTEDQSEAH